MSHIFTHTKKVLKIIYLPGCYTLKTMVFNSCSISSYAQFQPSLLLLNRPKCICIDQDFCVGQVTGKRSRDLKKDVKQRDACKNSRRDRKSNISQTLTRLEGESFLDALTSCSSPQSEGRPPTTIHYLSPPLSHLFSRNILSPTHLSSAISRRNKHAHSGNQMQKMCALLTF